MADVKISALTSAGTITGTEIVPVVSGGVTKRTTTQNIAELAVKTVKVSFNTAAVLALGTPATVIAAPGAGKVIDVLNVYMRYNYNTTDFAANTAPALYLGDDTNGNQLTADLTGFLESSLTTFGQPALTRKGTNLTTVQSVWENQAVKITTGGNPTTGDGSLDVWVTYQIVNL